MTATYRFRHDASNIAALGCFVSSCTKHTAGTIAAMSILKVMSATKTPMSLEK